MLQQSASRTSRLAWGLFTLIAVLAVGALLLFLLNRHTPVQTTWGASGGLRDGPLDWIHVITGYLVNPLGAGLLGALILTHHPRHRIGWLLLLSGLALAVNPLLGEWVVLNYFTRDAPLISSGMLALVYNALWVVPLGLVFLTIALFPTGHFLSRRWGALFMLPLSAFVGLLGGGSLTESPLSSAYQVPHPFLAETTTLYNSLFSLGVPMLPLTVLLSFVALMVRFRRADRVERQQIKWLLVFIALMLLTVTGGLLLAFGSRFRTVGEVIVNVSSVLPLIGVGLAILRHRLYDIDVVINRALVYGALTGALVLVYFGSIILLQSLLRPLLGSDSDFAIVLSTLTIAALFTPLRRRIQRFIDRRFFRSRYNAQVVLARFGASLRDRDNADLDALSAELLALIQQTVQPAQLSLWLREQPPVETEYR